ncbi:hypothetical protein ACRAJ3_09800 [Rhodococcus pyridinivorans]|uniref:hypothetical protein n=1 Tax=Rhodococcus pyridinivorans TaxID=103816 RepID=UPI003D7FA9BD
MLFLLLRWELLMSDPTIPEGRAELRQFLSKATPGKWDIYEDADDPDEQSIAAGDQVLTQITEWSGRADDAELVVVAVNALPALLGALDQTETELRHTRNNLDQARYGRTQGDLAIARVRALADEWDTLPCVCGYRIPNGNDDSSQCLSCAAEDLRTSLDGTS